MKARIIFSENKPKISIYGLEGVLLHLSGRTEHIVSKDPMTDTISTWFNFFIHQSEDDWKFGYESNCNYLEDEKNNVLNDLLNRANQAIAKRQSIDLSQEFNTLDQKVEPYTFSGLFAHMNEHHAAISTYNDLNRDISEMREILQGSMTANELEADKHLKSFVYQTPLETIWVDATSSNDKTVNP